MPIRCEIVSQDRIVYQGDVDIVIIPGAEGVMGILPHHAPVLTVLQYGIVTVKEKGENQYFTVAGGVAEVQPDQVTVLADSAENIAEIDIERAEAAKQRAEESLRKGVTKGTDQYLLIQAAIRRSNLRLEAVKKYRGVNQYKISKPKQEG
jgi:F-type H+-transporting ATPase subunit epsilon